MRPSPALRRYLHLERLAESGEHAPGIEAAWERLTPAEVRWLRARLPAGSPFEDEARAQKLGRLLAAVPPHRTARQLAKAPASARAALARAAGCREPSAATWSMLVDAVRARQE